MRKGFLTAGTWCLDRNITVDAWPGEDMAGIVDTVELAGGGCACNFAANMRRLDPSVPVETQGLVGAGEAGDFLLEIAADHSIEAGGIQRTSEAATQTTDAFLSAETGRRTHIIYHGTAKLLSPDHFDFSSTNARFLHLGLPGLHEKLDGPWKGDANGWLTVLKRAGDAGLERNFEFVAAPPERLRAIAAPCLLHLETLVVNDFEIGAIAGISTIVDGAADMAAVRRAAEMAMERGAMDVTVVHFTQGALLLTRDGQVVEAAAVAVPDTARVGANGAGDAFAAGFFYGRHEDWGHEACLRMGHAAAAASLRSAGTYTSVESADACRKLADNWGWRT